MAVRQIERELEQLSNLRNAEPKEAQPALRKALKDRVNVVVARAAKVAAEIRLASLIPDLCAAFERLLLNGIKNDPQCWGKNAIAKALKDLGHIDSELFLKAVQYVQMEPVWGGEEDTAATLRATCTLALLPCADLTRDDKLWHVMRLLTERVPSVRKDGALALEALDGREAALLLRIKARMGDEDPAVTGQLFESLVRIEGDAAVAFLVEFLKAPGEEVREEAALALGNSRLPAAVNALADHFGQKNRVLDDEILFRALAISRNEQAIEFLLNVLRTRRLKEALAALNALALNKDSLPIRARIEASLADRMEEEIREHANQLLG
jgi:HEAT repeat protein